MEKNIGGIPLPLTIPLPALLPMNKLLRIYVADRAGVRWQSRNTVTNMGVLNRKMF